VYISITNIQNPIDSGFISNDIDQVVRIISNADIEMYDIVLMATI